MYFPTFFPASVRSYDGRAPGLGGPLELPVMGTGREREIPLDLSIKTVRQSADSTADPDEVGLLLDHRKFLGLAAAGFAGRGLPSSLLDPASLFRLPYRTDAAACSGMSVPSIASPFCHPMMAGILQQRERCLDPHSVRTAAPQPVSPYMDPASAAALSLHLRSAAAAAAGVNAANQREANAAALSARGIFGVPTLQGSVGIPGYSLFPEFFQHASVPTLQPPPSTDPSRRPEEKGAFTTLRPTPTQPCTPTSSSSAASNDKTFLANSALDAARYAEHMQRIHEQHLQAKCSASCCVPTSASAVISGLAHHQATCGGGGSCASCVIPGSAPHCPTALSRGAVPHLSYATPGLNSKDASSPATRTPTSTPNSSAKNSSSNGSAKSEASTRSEPTMPIYVPTTTAWTSGLPNMPNQLAHSQGHVVYTNGTNTTTSHVSVGKSHQSSHQSSRKKDKERNSSKEHSSERSKFGNSPNGNPSRTPSSKDSGSSKLSVIEHSSRSNHHNHVQGQYHHSHHGSHHSKHSNSTAHQKSNNHHHRNNNSSGANKEDNEIIVIDDVEPKNSNLHRPQPTFPAIAGCNGLKIPTINSLDRSQGPPLHIPHRPVPEHRPRSPVKRSGSPSYPEVAQPIPSKMPRLEAVVRPNPGLPDPAESLSPTGPPSLIASVVPTITSGHMNIYLPPAIIPLDYEEETARIKKLIAMLPSSQHPIPFVNGNRVPVPNGIPSDSPRVPSPCPAVVEPVGAEVVMAVAASEPFVSPAFPGGTPYHVDNNGKEMSVATLAESNKSPRTRSPEATACGSSQSVVVSKPQHSIEKTSCELVSHTPLIIPVPVMSASIAAKKSYLASSARVSSPSSLAKKESDGQNPVDAAAADKRQRVLDLYSDLSEIDQQDLDGQKGVRLREFDSEASLLKSKHIKPETTNLQTTDVCTSEISPTKPSSNTGPYGASAARCEISATSTSPPPLSPKVKGRASVVEEELRQEALRVADARAKKKLRRRLLERLYHERMGIPCPDESETDSPPNEEAVKDEDDDVSDDAKEEFDEKTKLSSNEDIKSETEKSDGKGDNGQDRRALTQLNLTWRQRRLMQISCSHAVRRKRFRSGLDMIARRQKKKSKSQSNSEKKKEDQRKMCHMDEAFAKVVCEATGDLVMPPEMKRLMVNKALGETILHRAARQCYPDVVLYCLETKCCDVNARDNAGYTPLHECCSRGHLEIARALLQYGADVNASAAGGIRPLHDAVENDHVEVVRLLLSFGADPTISTYSGLSPLKLARSPVMAEFLRGFMADITGDADGRPVLPWQFMGSASCLDPEEMGFDILDGVPSDSGGDGELQVGGDDFLFEVSDSPHLPTFRLQLPSSKASCNCLRLSDVLKQTALSKDEFRCRFPLIEVVSMPRHEFEASATCSQLLTGTKLDALLLSAGDDPAGFVDVVKLDNQIRLVLGIETITLR